MQYKFIFNLRFGLFIALILSGVFVLSSNAHGVTLTGTCLGKTSTGAFLNKPQWNGTSDLLYIWRSYNPWRAWHYWRDQISHPAAQLNGLGTSSRSLSDDKAGVNAESMYIVYGPTTNIIRIFSDEWACARPPAPVVRITCAPDQSWLRLDWDIVPGQKLNLVRRRALSAPSWETDKVWEVGPLPYVNHPNLLPIVPGYQIKSWTDFSPHPGGNIYQVKTDVNVAGVTAGTMAELCALSQTNDASLSINLPGSFNEDVNQPIFVQVTATNTGDTTWTPADNYKLGVTDGKQAEADAFSLPYRFEMPAGSSIATGESVTFSFNATAPSTAGTYDFPRFQMLKEGVEWFGEKTPNISVNVIQPNRRPTGAITTNCTRVSGTVSDLDRSGQSLQVQVWDGPAPVGAKLTKVSTSNTGAFAYTFSDDPTGIKNGQPHDIFTYVQDDDGVWWPVSSGTVNCVPPPPVVLNPDVTEPNYCRFGPGGTVTWTYSSSGSPQTFWRVQIFTFPPRRMIYDSGKTLGDTTSITAVDGEPRQFQYATQYRTQVRVWDEFDTRSAWAQAPRFTTPAHAYPRADFSSEPPAPAAGLETTFTETTVYDPAAVISPPQWDFGDGTGDSGTPVVHTYQSEGDLTVRMTATDASLAPGGVCTAQKMLKVQKPIPGFKEVLPQ